MLLPKSASPLPGSLSNPESFCEVSVQCGSALLTTSHLFLDLPEKMHITGCWAWGNPACQMHLVLSCSQTHLRQVMLGLPFGGDWTWLASWQIILKWNIQIRHTFPCVDKLSLLCWVAWTRSWASAFPSDRVAPVYSHWKSWPIACRASSDILKLRVLLGSFKDVYWNSTKIIKVILH